MKTTGPIVTILKHIKDNRNLFYDLTTPRVAWAWQENGEKKSKFQTPSSYGKKQNAWL